MGITFSLMTLFSPNLVQQISSVLNRSVNIDSKLSYMDKEIQIDAFFYSHHLLFGICLVGGSLFSLIFFFFQLDVANLTRIFGSSSGAFPAHDILFRFVALFGKIVCLLGLIAGFIILFAPGKMKKIEHKLNSWFETKSVLDKLDSSSRDVDMFFFRHPVFFGLVGAVISFVIIILSIVSLLK
jgi:hypothetical protein